MASDGKPREGDTPYITPGVSGFSWREMMKFAALLLAALALAGCSDASTATRALQDAGYSDIQTTGYSFFSCGQDDTFATGFTATNPAGRRVSGTVCSGLLFKGATIRF